ncbi:AAA family ATPase [Kaarinaea lacus]
MYESFYNLHPTPFRLTPDPHFFYESDTHKRGLAYLRFAFYQEEGFVVITGAPGTGKTELMLNLVTELPRHKVTLAKIVTSNLDADDLLDLVAASFLIDPEHLSKGSLLKRLEDYFIHQARNGKHVLLMIDEAHNLSIKSLTELSMLSNFQIDEKPLMQCFLLGQDPLEEKLNIPELVHLKQRVLASTRLENLDQQETREYVMHRLLKSGWDNNPIIRDTAFALIYYYTQGIPRKINSLCNRVLLQSYLDDRHDIGADLVQQVIEELQEEVLGHQTATDLKLVDAQLAIDASLTSFAEINNEDIGNGKQMLPQNYPEKRPEIIEISDSNVIAIPEFIKKKETSQTQTGAPALPQTTDTHTDNKNFPQDEIDTVNEISINTPDTDFSTAEDGEEKALNDTPLDKQADSSEMNRPLHHRPASNPIQRQQNKRQSGLMDKELQALASLCEAPAYKQQPKTKSQTQENPKQLNQPAKPVKKIIIDDLVREDFERNEPAPTTPAIAEGNPSGIDLFNSWRPAVTVMAVLASIGLAVYWWSDSNTEIIYDTVEKQPASIIAENSVIDLIIPEVQTTLIEPTAAPDSKLGFSTTADTGSQTAVSEAAAGPVLFEESPTSTNIELPVVAYATEAGNTEANVLDKQITQILEKPGIKTTTETKTIPETKPEIKTTAIQTAEVKAPAKNTMQVSLKAAKTKPVSVVAPDTQPKAKSAASVPQMSAQLTASKASSNTTAAPLRTPIIGTPLVATETLATSADFTVSQSSDKKPTNLPQRAVASEQLVVAKQDNSFISGTDLNSLLATIATAYENGNLQQLISTFATDINSSDGTGRKQMESDYRHLFNITDNRQLTIQDVTWSQHDKQMLGKGDFQVKIREKGASKYTTYVGKISLAVVKESNNIVIRKLDYDYNN